MVTRIPLETGTTAPGGQTNAYIVGSEDALLIDPATSASALDASLSEHDVSHIALTHYHPDHVGGVTHYAEKYELTVWAREGRVAEFEKATGYPPDYTFQINTTLPVAGGLPVIDTPGHAHEHVSFVVTDTAGNQELLSGDLAFASGSVVVCPPDGDMRAYLSSLRRIHAMNPECLYPGHGPVIDTPRATCERLITHRLSRESKVLSAVTNRYETLEELVGVVYEKEISGVEALAKATIAAHLEKLAVEGTIAWDGDRATQRE